MARRVACEDWMGEVTQHSQQFVQSDALLQGTTVIEASAGTGKTWSIEQIALRRVKDGTPIERMLMTSFTRAAAAELSQRVCEVFRKALSEDAAAEASGQLTDEVRGRLQAALLAFDSACITTIDGFCLRMLQEHAAAAAAFGLAGWQLDPDAKGSQRRAVLDAWSASAMLDEVWATTVGAPSALNRPLETALGNPRIRERMQRADYPTAAAAWHVWVDAFVANNVLHAWFGDLAETLLAEGKKVVASLLDCVKRVGDAATTRDRAICAIDLGKALAGTALLCSNASAVTALAKKKSELNNKAHALTSAPLFREVQSQLSAGVQLWRDNVGAATNVIVVDAHARLTARRARLRIFSFQDVLERLVDALRVDNSPLLTAVRGLFDFAVVDEFQDTNLLQAEILERLFIDSPNHDLFLVGDPKQSIYAFRDADLESYLALRDRDGSDAARTHRRSLAVSYRSDRALVHAVNALFEIPEPFFHAKIKPDTVTSHYSQPRAAWKGAKRGAGIVVHHGVDEETLAVAWPCIARAIQEELSVGNMVCEREGDAMRPLRPSDIAVLCHTHGQNNRIGAELRALGVPAIVLGNATVFSSEAAIEITQIMSALARPDHPSAALAACAGRLLGMNHAQSIGEPALWLSRIRHASEACEKHGAAAAIEQLVESANSPTNGITGLTTDDCGERFLLDYRHLLELVTAAEADGICGANALSIWCAEQLESGGDGGGMGGDDRCRSRSIGVVNAVTIQTLHSSKGLTYGVTWLPTFMGKRNRGVDDGVSEAERERSAGEERRVLYVGLTRSRWRSHLIWLHGGKTSASPLATIVHARGLTKFVEAKAQAEVQLDAFALASADLTALAALAPSAIGIVALPLAHDVRSPLALSAELASPLALPTIPRWQDQVSFTALTRLAHRDDGDEERDRDRAVAKRDPNESGSATPCDVAITRLKVAGVSLGTALHESLAEPAAFAALALDADRSPLATALQRNFAGLVPESAGDATLFTDLASALASALASPCTDGVIPSVVDLAANLRATRREMNITTPWNGSPKKIADAFALDPAPWSKALAAKIRALNARDLNGLFVGNIDLVAVRNGAWFIYDYKSNRLGSSAQAYSSTRESDLLSPLDEAMISSLYPLQAALYAVAIERWLATRRGHTAALGTSIGGIAYLFVRGMDASIKGQGIWQWRPSTELVCALSACFLSSEPGPRAEGAQ